MVRCDGAKHLASFESQDRIFLLSEPVPLGFFHPSMKLEPFDRESSGQRYPMAGDGM
jgi:hypothetical protein